MTGRELLAKLRRIDDEQGHLDFDVAVEVTPNRNDPEWKTQNPCESIRVVGDTLIISDEDR